MYNVYFYKYKLYVVYENAGDPLNNIIHGTIDYPDSKNQWNIFV